MGEIFPVYIIRFQFSFFLFVPSCVRRLLVVFIMLFIAIHYQLRGAPKSLSCTWLRAQCSTLYYTLV